MKNLYKACNSMYQYFRYPASITIGNIIYKRLRWDEKRGLVIFVAIGQVTIAATINTKHFTKVVVS